MECAVKTSHSLYLKINNCFIPRSCGISSFLFVLTISFFLNFYHLQTKQSGLCWVAFCFIWPEDQGQIVKSSINCNFRKLLVIQSGVFESCWSQSTWWNEHQRWEIITLHSSLLLGSLLVMVFSPLWTAECEVKLFQLLLWEKDIKMSWGGSSQVLNVRAKSLLEHKTVWSY